MQCQFQPKTEHAVWSTGTTSIATAGRFLKNRVGHVRDFPNTHTHIYSHTHIFTYTHAHVCARAHTHTHTFTYSHKHTHTHMHTCAHTHIHTHTHTPLDTHWPGSCCPFAKTLSNPAGALVRLGSSRWITCCLPMATSLRNMMPFLPATPTAGETVRKESLMLSLTLQLHQLILIHTLYTPSHLHTHPYFKTKRENSTKLNWTVSQMNTLSHIHKNAHTCCVINFVRLYESHSDFEAWHQKCAWYQLCMHACAQKECRMHKATRCLLLLFVIVCIHVPTEKANIEKIHTHTHSLSLFHEHTQTHTHTHTHMHAHTHTCMHTHTHTHTHTHNVNDSISRMEKPAEQNTPYPADLSFSEAK